MSIYGGYGYGYGYNNYYYYGGYPYGRDDGDTTQKRIFVVAGDTWNLSLDWQPPEHTDLAVETFTPSFVSVQRDNVLTFAGEYTADTDTAGAGNFTILLAADDTRGFFAGTHRYSITLTSGGERYTAVVGDVSVTVPENRERSSDELALAKLENLRMERLEGGSIVSYSHGGQSTAHMSVAEINTEINRLRQFIYHGSRRGFRRMRL